MKNAKIKNRQKLGMLVVTMVLVLLITLIAGMLTGCGKNTARSTDGTESNSAGGNGSAGGGKGRFIESKVALPEEINSILQFKALADGTLEIVGQDADYGIYVAKSSDEVFSRYRNTFSGRNPAIMYTRLEQRAGTGNAGSSDINMWQLFL